jgi:hypothetical protein
MRQIFQQNNLQENFLHTGYARVPMLTPEQVNHLLDELKNLRPDDNFDPAGKSRFGSTYHCSFLDTNKAYKRATNRLITGVFQPYVEKYLVNFQILNCNFYVKPPQTGEFVIHQNWPAISDINDTTVTIWCPLVDVVASNGAIQVVEGSHKIVPHVEGPTNPGYFNHFRKELIEKYLKPMPMKAGEGLIFDDGLIHWSARNGADEPRIAIQILCTPRDAQSVYYYFDKAHPERFELIDVDTDFFIESSFEDLLTRQPHWKSLGFVENKNRFLTEDEFVDLLKRGDEIRREIYAGQGA